MRKTTVATTVVLGALLASTEAGATEWRIKDTTVPHERTDVSAMLTTPWFLGIGGGARVGLPIIPNGFIRVLNDAAFLEVGVLFETAYYIAYNYYHFSFPAMLRWEFYLTDYWSVYAVMGFAVNFPVGLQAGYPYPAVGVAGLGTFEPVFGIGANWHFTEHMAMRVESSTLGLQAGLLWQL